MSSITKISSAVLFFTFSLIASAGERVAAEGPISSKMAATEKEYERTPRTLLSKEYPDNFIACRAHEPAIVNQIVAAVIAEDVDVVLYFHGGLSSQEYVVTDLGPSLIKSVFSQTKVILDPGEDPEHVQRKLYPIFMNYDAGVWDWDKYSNETQKIAGSQKYKAFEASIKEKLSEEGEEYLAAEGQTSTSRTAAEIVYQFDRNKSLRAFSELSEDQQTQYFLDILQADDLPQQFMSENNTVQGELETLSKLYRDVDYEYSENNKVNALNGVYVLNSGIKKSLLSSSLAALRVLRIFARMALGNDHGLDATIAEEVFDGLHVSTLGEVHWEKVKRHAKQCFSEDSNGRNLVNKLITVQQGRNRKIHTWSHSAGSIPTAELIHYLGDAFDNKRVLNQVQMVAPAINQKDFSTLVLSHPKVFNHLQAYALTQKFERKDKLIWGLYPASLLYAVSSLAENTYYLDKMLLLDQHMQPKRRPYRYGLYRAATGEHSKDIWNYFLGATHGNADLYLYPQAADTVHVNCGPPNAKCGPSHEGTKLPWLSTDLTRHVLERFQVIDAQNLTFP